jgi:outer membrane protein assembly factor BamB
MKRYLPMVAVIITASLAGISLSPAASPNASTLDTGVAFHDGKGGELTKIALPAPEAFTTPDGHKGWRIKIPGGRPLATPAVVNGVLFVGGGFGSHEFYALDARTGAPVWTFKTGDDGPTAAVAGEGCVAYNTESCTLYVHDASSGKVLWQKWLGDPLMSQPSIGGSRIFMAYPGQGGHHLVALDLKTGKVLWDQPIDAEVISAPILDGDDCYLATTAGTLFRFDQATGRLAWKNPCCATSAPVIVGGDVFISQRIVKTLQTTGGTGKDAKQVTSEATLEGLNRADPVSGKLAWKEPMAAVQAGYLLTADRAGQQVLANTTVNAGTQLELRNYAVQAGNAISATMPAADPKIADLKKRVESYQSKAVDKSAEGGIKDAAEADQLAVDLAAAAKASGPQAQLLQQLAESMHAKAAQVRQAAGAEQDIAINLKASSKEAAAAQKDDASVAFSVAPASANLAASGGNIGQGNVKSVWAFQGSRPLPYKGGLVVIQGSQFRCVPAGQDKALWQTTITSKVDATRPATPPALAGGKVYFGTADGRIVCADPASGKTLWEDMVGGRILFQPAVVNGRVYAATDDGALVCLDTQDPTADGWSMWGGSAQHNAK